MVFALPIFLILRECADFRRGEDLAFTLFLSIFVY